jgi:hypothetical protein
MLNILQNILQRIRFIFIIIRFAILYYFPYRLRRVAIVHEDSHVAEERHRVEHSFADDKARWKQLKGVTHLTCHGGP